MNLTRARRGLERARRFAGNAVAKIDGALRDSDPSRENPRVDERDLDSALDDLETAIQAATEAAELLQPGATVHTPGA